MNPQPHDGTVVRCHSRHDLVGMGSGPRSHNLVLPRHVRCHLRYPHLWSIRQGPSLRPLVLQTSALPAELQVVGWPGRGRTCAARISDECSAAELQASCWSARKESNLRRELIRRLLCLKLRATLVPSVGFEPTPHSLSSCGLCPLGYEGLIGGTGGARTLKALKARQFYRLLGLASVHPAHRILLVAYELRRR